MKLNKLVRVEIFDSASITLLITDLITLKFLLISQQRRISEALIE